LLHVTGIIRQEVIMETVLDLLVKIQDLDDEIANNEALLTQIPQDIAKLEKQIAARDEELKSAEARVLEIKKNYRMKEIEIADNEDKVAKLNAQTFAVKTNEEYRAVLNEIDFLKRRNKEIEDTMIELMEEEEKLRNSIERMRAETGEFTGRTRESIAAMKQRMNELTERQAVARHDHDRDFALLPADARNLYARVTKVRHRAVCAIVNNTCTGCFANLTHQLLNELKKRDKMLLCDNCGRILIYTGSRE
jgi:predicted  nucleic acid-binding Zn-ribbon protein